MARNRDKNRLIKRSWVRGLTVGAGTFLLAVLVTWPSQSAVLRMRLVFVFPVLLLIVAVGVLFDMVGVAVAKAQEAPFHAMAAKRVPGAAQALRLVRNAERVASFCNDIVGDLAGTIAGAASTVVAFRLLEFRPHWDQAFLSMLVVGLVAAITVGAKAAGKGVALRRAGDITWRVGRLLYWVERAMGRRSAGRRRRKARGR